MPVWYYGTEDQKQRFIGGATSDASNEFIVGYAASEPAGSPGGTANFDAPAVGGAGMGVTATRDGDEYVMNGKKYWPCNVGGWDNKGANLNLVVCRTDGRTAAAPRACRRSSSSAAPRASATTTSARGPALRAELPDHVRQRASPGGEHDRGRQGQRRSAHQPQLRLVGPGRRHRRGRGRPRRVRGRPRVGQDVHRRRPEADHPLPVPGLRARRCRGEDRGGPVLLLEVRPLPRPARLPRRDARRDVQDPLHRDAVRLRLQVHAGRRSQLRRPQALATTATCARRPSCRSTTRATSACSVAAYTASWPTRRSTRARSWTTRRSSSPRRWRASTPSRVRPPTLASPSPSEARSTRSSGAAGASLRSHRLRPGKEANAFSSSVVRSKLPASPCWVANRVRVRLAPPQRGLEHLLAVARVGGVEVDAGLDDLVDAVQDGRVECDVGGGQLAVELLHGAGADDR